MNLPERKEDQVRRLLDRPHPPVPPDLASRAATRGHRLLRHRRAARAMLWTVFCVAVVAFTVWMSVSRPWQVPPDTVTPPGFGW